MTVAFWDPIGAHVLQAVLARRDASDSQFGKANAWDAHALWQPSDPPTTLARHSSWRCLADDRRLSVGSTTHAGVLPGWRLDDSRWWRAGSDDWDTLRATVTASTELLGERGDMLSLRPPYERWKAERLDNLEAWATSGAAVAGIIVHRDPDGASGLLEPITLLVE